MDFRPRRREVRRGKWLSFYRAPGQEREHTDRDQPIDRDPGKHRFCFADGTNEHKTARQNARHCTKRVQRIKRPDNASHGAQPANTVGT